MRLTRIKKQNGTKLNSKEMNTLITALIKAIKAEHFITDVEQVNGSSIKIGLRMRSFSLDTTYHPKNLQHSPYATKQTNLPSWDQRVIFNDVVNGVLNKLDIHCKVISGPYIIRDGNLTMTESDWYDQTPDWLRNNQSRGWYIEQMTKESLAEYLEEKRIERNEKSRERRAQNKTSPVSSGLITSNDFKKLCLVVSN